MIKVFLFLATKVSDIFRYLFTPFYEKSRNKNFCIFYPVSRTGRHHQRYEKGYRQVVGCIPYRYKKRSTENSSKDGLLDVEEIEILMISAQKDPGMLFPKGGWEEDESMEDAVLRELREEAGVIGQIGQMLGKWTYKSKRGSIMHEAYMFPLLVLEQFENWPEQNIRNRRWVSISEAREVCQCSWMIEALDKFVGRPHKDDNIPK